MAYSLYDMGLQRIMVVVFVKTDIKSKMINTTTMIPRRHISQRELVTGSYIGSASANQIIKEKACSG